MTAETKPKISIILPTYNGSGSISKAIESALAQTFTDFELIIINDASKDNTGDIVKNFAKNDSRIVYVRNEQNLRLQKTLNKGLSLARGEYIARIDDDDIWIDKNKLKIQADFLDKNTDYVLVGTFYNKVNEKGEILPSNKLPTLDSEIRKVILSYNPFGHSTVMLRKKEIMSLGGYSEDKKTLHMEDYDLWLKIGTVGKFAIIDTITTNYLSKNNGLAKQAKGMDILKFRLRAIKKYSKYYNGKTAATLNLIKHVIPAAIKRFKNKK